MHILVTGGTGFLGTALITRLVDLGHKVRVLARPSSDVSWLPPGVQVCIGDVTALASLVAAADSVECIIHLAALVQAWAPDPSLFHKVNVGGTENVLHVLREVSSVRRVLYTSSFFALGPTDGKIADGTESSRPLQFCTEYERTKYLADQVVLRAVREEHLDVVLVYPGVIYGPGRVSTSNLLVQMIVDQFRGRLPGLIGKGDKLNCLVHVNDVVAGMLSALEEGIPGKRYILGGENASIVRVFDIVRDVTRRKPPSLRIPFWAARIIGFCAVVVARLGGPVPIFTYSSVDAFMHDWAYSSTTAAADFGYKPVDLRHGLTETLLWLRGNGIISF